MTEPVSQAIRFERMRAALQVRAQTYKDLQAISGFCMSAVRRWVNDLHAAHVLHICGWAEDERGRPFIKKFKLGNKPDAERPGPDPKKAAARVRRMRQRRKKEAG